MAPSLGKLQACHTGTRVSGLKAPKSAEAAVERVEETTVLKKNGWKYGNLALSLSAAKTFKLRPELRGDANCVLRACVCVTH